MQSKQNQPEKTIHGKEYLPESRNIRVVVADDHEAVRTGMACWLTSQSDMEVIGQAADGVEAVRLARELHPDFVIMDVSMPLLNGIEATKVIARELPAVAVIGVSVDDSGPVVNAMRRAGAADFLPKYKSPELLVTALRKYHKTAA